MLKQYFQMAVRIISLNTGGLGDLNKRRKIFNFYRDRCDILCLQETHSSKTDQHLWEAEWGGVCLFAHGETNARGVAILFNRRFYCNITEIIDDMSGRTLMCNIEKDGLQLALINIYAPNADSPGFFEDINVKMQKLYAAKVLIGDFNLVMNEKIDRKNSNYNNYKARDALFEIMNDNYLCDVWRNQNPEDTRYSWYRSFRTANKTEIKASRIDMAIVSQGIASRTENCFYLIGISSDHSALCIIIHTNVEARGRGFWKLNAMLLKDKDYVDRMNEKLERWLKESENLKSMDRWEKLKENIATFTQKYADIKASERKIAISQLVEEITHLEDGIESISDEDFTLLEKSKADLDDLTNEHIKSVIFRSKATWYCEAERNTKYFYNLEKSRSMAKTVSSLINEKGDEVTDGRKILKMQENFYADLYKKDLFVCFDVKEDPPEIVQEDDIAYSEKPFSKQEIAEAVLGLRNNRTPGPDGIGIDFYKIFWAKIGDLLCDAIHEMFQENTMISSSSCGIINLIPKKNKDMRFLKNLRPITLLNSDYKVIEKAIAARMIPAMDTLISQDQKGFLPGRKITVNIRKAFDLLKFVKQKDLDAVYITCDFQKAFDSISTECLIQTLKKYHFSSYIIKWTQVLYNNFTAKVQNNGHLSNSFEITEICPPGSAQLMLLFCTGC